MPPGCHNLCHKSQIRLQLGALTFASLVEYPATLLTVPIGASSTRRNLNNHQLRVWNGRVPWNNGARSMCLPFVLILLSSVNVLFVQGRMISCACNTTPCREEGVTTCNTTSLCFSQFLDREDGSEKLLRGCMASRTPLLCENRRPAVGHHHKWPVLVCCSKNMCNSKVSPTMPPTTTTTTAATIPPPGLADVPSSTENSPGAMNVIYLLMVAIGVCCIGVGTAIAVFLSRRHSAYCDPEFGTVGPNGYVKGCCSDPHIPKAKIIENKITLT